MIRKQSYLILLAGAIAASAPVSMNAYVLITVHNTTTTAVQCAVTDQGWGDSGTFGQFVSAGATAGPYGVFFIANGTGTFSAADHAGNPYTVYPTSFTADSSGNGTLTLTVGGGGGSQTATNSGCITLVNNTDQVQYYQFGYQNPSVNGGSPVGFSGCSTNISASATGGIGTQGNDPNTPNNFMAVYPGESITVCHNDTSPTGDPSEFIAYQPPAGSYPCNLIVGQPRCVSLCSGDGIPVTSPAFGGAGSVAQFVPESTGNGVQSGLNPNPGSTNNGEFSGTNGILWEDSQTNGGLMLDETGKEGFAALHNDAVVGNAANAANTFAVQASISNAAAGIITAVRSNTLSISNLTFSNTVSFTNFPTNFPDMQAIGLLGTIATNTSRTNIDTNLDALAAAIASNTAAPLAYTNLDLGAYSTNPQTTVSYASNTLAAPINQSMLGYANTALVAGDNVSVGGSPGSLLTISFSLPGVGTYTIDCNPMDNPDIADFASWFRSVTEWLVGIGFIGLVLRDGTQATRSALMTPQGQFPKLEVLGTSLGWPLAAVYIVAIVAAIVAVPFAIVTWFAVGSTGQMWWAQIAVNPFSGAGVGRAVGLSLWLADQFVPMSYVVSSALYYIGFRFVLNGVVTVAAIIVRALMA